MFSCDPFLKLFKKQQPWKRDVQKWGFWHQLISFICDMQLGPFPQEVLCLLVNTVNYTDWLVSVEQNHWNKYTNLSLNLSLVCQYVCPDKHGPWLFFKFLINEILKCPLGKNPSFYDSFFLIFISPCYHLWNIAWLHF